jgi:hypothetical protein
LLRTCCAAERGCPQFRVSPIPGCGLQAGADGANRRWGICRGDEEISVSIILSRTTAADYRLALATLRGCRAQLRAAYADASGAAPYLTGVGATRVAELADKAADAIAHCERLLFILAADVQAQQSEAGQR